MLNNISNIVMCENCTIPVIAFHFPTKTKLWKSNWIDYASNYLHSVGPHEQ